MSLKNGKGSPSKSNGASSEEVSSKYGYELTHFFVMDIDKKEPKNILFFYPKNTNTDRMLNTVGLTIGIIRFCETFGSEVRSIMNDSSDFYFYRVDNGDVYVACILKKVKQPTMNKVKVKDKVIGKSCIGLKVKNFFPKNNFINSELKKSIQMYFMLHNELDVPKLEEFYLKFIHDYFLSEKNQILLNYLSAALYKFRVPFKIKKYTTATKKGANIISTPDFSINMSRSKAKKKEGRPTLNPNKLIPFSKSSGESLESGVEIEYGEEEFGFEAEGDFDGDGNMRSALMQTEEERLFYNNFIQDNNALLADNISLYYTDPKQLLNLIGVNRSDMEKQSFLLNKLVPIYLKVLEDREKFLQAMYENVDKKKGTHKGKVKKVLKKKGTSEKEEVEYEVFEMFAKVRNRVFEESRVKILSYFVIDAKDYLVSSFNVDSLNINLILNYVSMYHFTGGGFLRMFFNGEESFLLQEIRSGLKFYYVVSKKPPKTLFERNEMKSFCSNFVKGGSPKRPNSFRNGSSTAPTMSNMLFIKYYAGMNLISRNLNNFFLIYLLNDFLEKKEIKEQVFKLTKTFWFVLLRKTEKKFFFIILNEKNISLNEIDQRVIQGLLN